MERYTVLVEWQDGPTEDADEVTVDAASRDEAVAMAVERWRESVAAWPTCTLVKAWLLDEAIAEDAVSYATTRSCE